MRVLVVRAESVTAQLQHPRLQFVALRIIAHPGGKPREDGEHLGAEGVVGAEGSLAEAELVVEEGLALLAGRVLVVSHQEHLQRNFTGCERAGMSGRVAVGGLVISTHLRLDQVRAQRGDVKCAELLALNLQRLVEVAVGALERVALGAVLGAEVFRLPVVVPAERGAACEEEAVRAVRPRRVGVAHV